jgi:hypothetical protein
MKIYYSNKKKGLSYKILCLRKKVVIKILVKNIQSKILQRVQVKNKADNKL